MASSDGTDAGLCAKREAGPSCVPQRGSLIALTISAAKRPETKPATNLNGRLSCAPEFFEVTMVVTIC